MGEGEMLLVGLGVLVSWCSSLCARLREGRCVGGKIEHESRGGEWAERGVSTRWRVPARP